MKKIDYLEFPKNTKVVDVRLHETLEDYIKNNSKKFIKESEKKHKIKINLIPDNSIAPPFAIIKTIDKNKKDLVLYDDLPKSLEEEEDIKIERNSKDTKGVKPLKNKKIAKENKKNIKKKVVNKKSQNSVAQPSL